MNDLKENKNPAHVNKMKSMPSLIINLILPWILYNLLRRMLTNDAILLSITGTIPAARTLFQWISKRKIDYLGIIAIICFVIALTITALSGGNPLPLKIVHPMAFGIIGLSSIVSVIIGKPLLIFLYRIISPGNSERLSSAAGRKKLTSMSLILGVVLLASSTVHIILALTLPTGTFLAMNSVVNWVTILTLVGCAKIMVPRISKT